MPQSTRLALGKILLVLICLTISGESTSFGDILAPSNGGNAFLHGLGWQTFDNVTTGNSNSGVSDTTPDSNSTFDATPVGANNSSRYLSGIIGAGASSLGRQGFGRSNDISFLNGPTFGSSTVPFGLNIVDVPLANGSAGARIGPQGVGGANSWKFRTNGDQEFGDFSITNESDFAFRFERIHYDARRGGANSPQDLDLVYLAGGSSNLTRADNGNELVNLNVLSAINFATPGAQNITQSLAAVAGIGTAVRLAPGDSASFRFRWTNSGNDFGQSQIDNLAISGTFQDQNNGFASINPVDVTAVPEPSGILLIALGCVVSGFRRRRLG